MSSETGKLVRLGILVISLATLVATVSVAQDKKLDERYSAFAVAMGPGISGVLEFTVTRYSTDAERKALVDSLAANGQDKTVELLRKQPETGFARTQTGAGMQGWPSTRLYYAHQVQQDGKRVVVLVTERNVSMAEQMSQSRSTDYNVSAIVMEMTPVQGDTKLVEKGTGTYYPAIKMSFDKDNKLKVEAMGQQPVRLPDIRREK